MSGELSDSDTVLASSGNYSLIGQVIGNYKVTDVLGQGGFGAVYKAEDTKLGRTVALKFLRQADEKFHAELFEREARALGALSKHNNIVQIHAWDEYKGANFFVLEFMSSSVADEIKKYPDGMPIDMALRIIAECADALAFAHEAEILHRDIKAQNILLEELDGTAKIADFGLARICGTSAHTIEGSAIGSPVYMAPEQARGQKLTHLCDIYSLGVTLYELLSGKPSVAGSSILEVLEKVRNNDRVPLRTMKPGLPDAVYAIVDRATAPEPANRYQTAADMAADLRKIEVNTTESPAPIVANMNDTKPGEDLAPLTTSAAAPVVDAAQKPAPIHQAAPTPTPQPAPIHQAAPTPAPQPNLSTDSQSNSATPTGTGSMGSGIWKLAAVAIVVFLSGAAGYGIFAYGSRETPEDSSADVAVDSPDTSQPATGNQPPEGSQTLEGSVAVPQETVPWLQIVEEPPSSELEPTPPTLADSDSKPTEPEQPEDSGASTPKPTPSVMAETKPEPNVPEQPKVTAKKEEKSIPQGKREPAVNQKEVLTKEAASIPPKSEPAAKKSANESTETKATVSASSAESKPAEMPAEVESSPTDDAMELRSGKGTVVAGSDSEAQSSSGTSADTVAETTATAEAESTSSAADESTSGEDVIVKRRGKSTVIVRQGSDAQVGAESGEEMQVEAVEPETSSSQPSNDDSSSDERRVRRRGKGSVIVDE